MAGKTRSQKQLINCVTQSGSRERLVVHLGSSFFPLPGCLHPFLQFQPLMLPTTMALMSLQNSILPETAKLIFSCLLPATLWLSQTGCFPCSSPPKSFHSHSNGWTAHVPPSTQVLATVFSSVVHQIHPISPPSRKLSLRSLA